MIFAKMWYKMHNLEFLIIVKAFKPWRHYLDGCKYKVLVFTKYNNPRLFMNTKSLSSRQIYWAQELSQYYFYIGYYQEKANTAINTLFQFLQRSSAEEKTFRNKNTQIFRCLQASLTKASLVKLTFSSFYSLEETKKHLLLLH